MATEELTINRIIDLIKFYRANSSAHRDTIILNKSKIVDLLSKEMEAQREIKEQEDKINRDLDKEDRVYTYYDKDYFISLRDALYIVNNIKDTPEQQKKLDTKPLELAKKANDAAITEIKKIKQTPIKDDKVLKNNTTKEKIESSPKKEKNNQQEIIKVEESSPKKVMVKITKNKEESEKSKLRRTGDQIHQAEMEKLTIQRLHHENVKNSIIETERHHKQQEKLDELKILKAEKEQLTKQLENEGKTKRALLLSKSKNYASKQHTQRFVENLKFLQTDAGQKLTLDKSKTTKSIETSRTRREKLKRERAELALEKQKLSNVIREKQLEDRKRRDLEKDKKRKQQEQQRKKDKIKGEIYDAIKDGSPALAYAIRAGSFLMPKKSTQDSVSDGGLASGIGSFLGTGLGLTAGKFLGKFKGIPMVDRMSNRMTSSKIASKTNIVSKLPKGLGGVASKIPIIGSLIAAGLDFSETKSIGSATSVGLGSMAGVTIGAAAGAILGPPGIIIGGIIGGYLGASGAKTLYNKVMGYFGFGESPSTGGGLDKVGAKKLPEFYDGSFKQHSVVNGSSLSGMSSKSYEATSKSTITGNSKLSKDASEAMDFFMKKGWSKDEAAAIVGNLITESNLNPSAKNINGKEASYGIAQWNNKGSPERLKEFKKLYGKDIKDASKLEQMEFVHHELTKGSDAGARRAGELIKGKSASQGAVIFDQFYERSSGQHRQKRSKIAEELMASNRTQQLISTNKQLDKKQKEIKKSPTNVNIVSGGGSSGGNISTTTIINAPDTDPTIRVMSYQHLHISRI